MLFEHIYENIEMAYCISGGERDYSEEIEAMRAEAEAVLADITEYHSKKLEILRLKQSTHEATRPRQRDLELVELLRRLYAGQPNGVELWTDMFRR
jgi:hypothetical protein